MLFKISSIVAALAATATAHMSMTTPCSRYTSKNPKCPSVPAGQSLDYSLKSPLAYKAPLCKHTAPYATPVETWNAGDTVTVDFEQGGAAHGGGHCQFSLSYDGGKTFVVVHEELKYCFFGHQSSSNQAEILKYSFQLPKDLPSSQKAVFAWSWVNAIGNREFYMNCADVAIKGTSDSYTGKSMVVANHQGGPWIDEFNGNYDTGLKYYTGAPKITVKGDGSSGGGNPPPYTSDVPVPVPTTTKDVPIPHKPTSSEVPVPETSAAPVTSDAPVPTTSDAPVTSVVPVPTTTSDVPVPETSVAPQPTTSTGTGGGNDGCKHGTMKCTADGSGFNVCVWGKWAATEKCATGTKCKDVANGVILCGWP